MPPAPDGKILFILFILSTFLILMAGYFSKYVPCCQECNVAKQIAGSKLWIGYAQAFNFPGFVDNFSGWFGGGTGSWANGGHFAAGDALVVPQRPLRDLGAYRLNREDGLDIARLDAADIQICYSSFHFNSASVRRT